MGRTAKASDATSREIVPPGNYYGIVCGVYHLGTQDGGQYGAKEKIFLQWELHKRKGPARNKLGEVFTVGKFYTFSLNAQSTLRPDVEAIIGRPLTDDEEFDIETLLDRQCRLYVVNGKNSQGNLCDKVETVTPLDEEDPRSTGELDALYVEADPSKPIREDCPKWIREMIEKSHEFREHASGFGKKEPAAAAAGARPTHKPPRNNQEFDEFD